MGNCCRRILYFQFTRKEELVLAQIPQELITEVLKRLPVKSLLRFRCVSKSFCAIINSQYFVKSHLKRSAQDRSHLNLIFPDLSAILTNNNKAKLHIFDDFGFSVKCDIDVYGYCNGVFLMLLDKKRPALWNPSTRQYRILPKLPDHRDGVYYEYNRMGLGYDSFQDDYKVVVIHPFSVNNKPHTIDFRVWIFRLRLNKWRRVYTDFLAGASEYCPCYFGYFAHGGLHWLFRNVTNYPSNLQQIVAFNLAKETFSILNQPDYGPIKKDTHLDVLDGRLCFSCVTEDEALLYVRKKDGADFTWSLLYSVTINQLPPFMKYCYFRNAVVLGYLKEGDKIILDFVLFKYLVSYDLKKKIFQPTQQERHPCFRKIRSFVESLASVHATDP